MRNVIIKKDEGMFMPINEGMTSGIIARAATEEFMGTCTPANHVAFNSLLDIMVRVYRAGQNGQSE